ncbi:FCD domain-containing protein [Nocardioides sp. zg-579]|uniref:FCD domain-containing protein n=1 Tax=Nocardioides marmotae TaxID=2663857 RepID=A0A6I3J0I8_9ACTN|nr:GntR family transcriptional regulator [Nocardioides marmotae]MCR6030075.1 FCD domain-containing protein [Gordonia jinghuaiqii]MTB93706.1 FCD domain-containing protein [Nocardioides marmotae]QKE00051.1 GntR family transcriptional regulator [Nocardioides marmotae]
MAARGSSGAGTVRRRSTLSNEVAAHVRALVMAGALKPGEFVRMERIADELEVSITPVREGLHTLSAEGFLTFEPRRGFMVAPLSAADIRDLFWVQADIAGELAARAAARATSEDLVALRALQRDLGTASQEGRADDVVDLNWRIHRHVNLLAGSPKLAFLLSVAVRYVPLPFFATIPGWSDASVHDHEAVFRALEEHDAEAARVAMHDHIAHAGDLLAQHFDHD